jgi:hypothetical protein
LRRGPADVDLVLVVGRHDGRVPLDGHRVGRRIVQPEVPDLLRQCRRAGVDLIKSVASTLKGRFEHVKIH